MAEPGKPGEPRKPGDVFGKLGELGKPGSSTDKTPLRHLRAAQLRNRVVRGGLVRIAFGMVFLVGALAHALSPQRHEQSSLFWISVLLLMSTVNVALGLRAVGRARRGAGRSWLPIAVVWGVLAMMLLGLLLRR